MLVRMKLINQMFSLYRVIVDDDVLDVTSTLLTNKVHFDVVDFDNHLDNISSDWKNTSLNYQVESILSDIKDQKS